MKISTKLLLILAIVILYGAGVLTGMNAANKRVNIETIDQAAIAADSEAQTANMMLDTGAELLGFPNTPVNTGDTVWSVLERLSQKQTDLAVEAEQYQDMGMLIKSIKGLVNGTDGQYWQYWLNNKYADVASDKQAVKAGDVIMWKFTKAQFKEY